MKIKTKKLSWTQLQELPRPKHKKPIRPHPLFRTVVRVASIPDLLFTHFRCERVRMEAAGDGPWLILMNHSSFIDLEIAQKVLYPRPVNIVCTSDGQTVTFATDRSAAVTNPTAKLAMDQIKKLRDTDAHATVILSETDTRTLKKLGIRLTTEPAYETDRLYRK